MLLQELLSIYEKWSGEVKTAKHPPKDLFATGKASEIASWLKRSHPDDLKGAVDALEFYVNRAGKNLSAERKQELAKAKTLLK